LLFFGIFYLLRRSIARMLSLHVRSESLLRSESAEVSVLDGDDAHVTDGSILLLAWCGSVVTTGSKGRIVAVLASRRESALVTGKLTVRPAKLLLTHVLETHVVSTTHGALVTTVPAHTLTRSGTVHVVHGVVVHVGVTAHVAGVRVVTPSTAVVAVVATVSTVTAVPIPVAVVVHAQVHHTLLSLVTATTATIVTARAARTTTTVVILVTVLFTLQLGLNSLAVRRVADHGQDGSDVVDKLHKREISSRVSIEHSLIKTRTVHSQPFAERGQHSPKQSGRHSWQTSRAKASPVGLGSRARRPRSFGARGRPHGCTIRKQNGLISPASETVTGSRVTLTFSITLELNFCTDKTQTLPTNWRIKGSLNRTSFKSKTYSTQNVHSWPVVRSKGNSIISANG
jgi:hypothetical protein